MTCFMCKGDMTNGETTYFADLGRCIIIIKNVPCFKCTQCGEIAYSGSVVQELECITDTLANTLTEIAVVRFDAPAA